MGNGVTRKLFLRFTDLYHKKLLFGVDFGMYAEMSVV